MKIDHVCICGTTFATTEKRIAQGRGKYCSKRCGYANMSRPSGLTYELTRENGGCFKKGENLGPQHPLWKDVPGYRAIHIWINAHRPKAGICAHCGTPARTDWANISGNYQRDLPDWIELCRKCHMRYDGRAA